MTVAQDARAQLPERVMAPEAGAAELMGQVEASTKEWEGNGKTSAMDCYREGICFGAPFLQKRMTPSLVEDSV